MDKEEMPVDLKRGIVRILAADGMTTAGTGFILSEKGIIVTCSHVVQAEKLQFRGYPRPERVEIVFRASGERATARLLPQAWRAADGEDVAFLQLEGPLPQDVEPLALASSDGAAGHQFQTFGFPDQSPEEGLYGEGRLIEQTGIQGMKVWQVKSSEITPGFSGGPVYDLDSRRVVGLVTSIAAPDRYGRLSETAFVTPAETLFSIYPAIAASDVRPYMGLAAFTENDSEFFFGRRKLVEGLEEALRYRLRFLLVMGPSGSGKSSLVQAGLIPRLRKGSVPGSDRWGIIVARPADRPFENLERAGLRGAYADLAQAVRSWRERNPGQDKLLLILDQFEEFLVTCPPDLRQRLWEGLKGLIDLDMEITIMAVMRDDFYSRFASDAPSEVLAWTQRGFFQVGSGLEKEELEEIIREPARRVGLRLEEGLVQAIINDVLDSSREGGSRAGRSTILPLLEFALTQLWERREQGALTHQAYQAIGGVTGSLTLWADQVCRSLERDGLGPVARRVFTDLVNLGEGALPDSRRQRRLADLMHGQKDQEEKKAVQTVVQRLADARLATTSRDKDEESVQIIHDSLIREWARLQRWLKKDHAFLSWQRELEKDALEWRESAPGEASGRDEGRLLRGRRLEEAERWLREREQDLGEGEREFLQASLDLRVREKEKEEKAKAEKERTRRRIFQGIAIFSIFSLALAFLADDKMLEANDRKEEALARSLASQSEQMRDLAGSLTERVQLAVESLKHKETPEGFAALRKGLALLPRPVLILRHNNSTVWTMDYSPDGKILATSNFSGVWLWRSETGEKLSHQPLQHRIKAMSIDFSLDGRELAIGTYDGKASILNISSGSELFLRYYDGAVYSVAFSPDGKRLAVGGDFSTIFICNLSTNTTKEIPLPDYVRIYSLAFSPDGTKLAASNDTHQTSPEVNTVMIWNTSTWDLMIQTPENMHSDKIQSIAFSPDSTLLATGCRSGKAKIINASTGKEVMAALDHGKSVVGAVSFSPDGSLLATATEKDQASRIWDLSSQRVVARMDHDGPVRDIAFSPDGSRVATASDDGTAIIWDLIHGEPLSLNYRDCVQAIAFSPDGTKFASASNDSTAKVWNLSTGSFQFNLSHDGGVMSLAFSRDGRMLATGCRSGKAMIWDASDGRPLTPWLEHNGSVNYVAFSPDGTKLATAGGDDCARVWDATTGKLITRLNHSALVAFVAFSPDGKKLATASWDHPYSNRQGFSIIMVWNSSNWNNSLIHEMNGGNINSMKFSPNGKWLAIGGQYGAFDIIDMENGPPKNLRRDGFDVYDMNFSPDGTKLAVTGMSGNVWIYDAITWRPIMKQKIEGYGKSVAFSPDGSKIAIGSSENIALLLNASTGKDLLDLQHYGEVLTVAFSPDGKKLATGSGDGTARIWTLDLAPFAKDACNRLTHNMTREEWSRFMDNPDSVCLTCPTEGSFNHSSTRPWEQWGLWGRRECQPCGGSLG